MPSWRASPGVTYLARPPAAVLTGSVVIETIFSIPGVGRFSSPEL